MGPWPPDGGSVSTHIPPEPRAGGDSGRKGKAVEHLVAASVILGSGDVLNVSTSFVDDEGVDLIFHRRGRPETLAVQVKSRSWRSKGLSGGVFATDVRRETFAPRDDLYLLYVAVDEENADYGPVWLVPSKVLARQVRPNSYGRFRFVASAKEASNDRWRRYRLEKKDLPQRLLEILSHLERRDR